MIQSADCQPRQRVSICSNFPTTGGKARSKRSSAMQSTLTRALNYHEVVDKILIEAPDQFVILKEHGTFNDS